MPSSRSSRRQTQHRRAALADPSPTLRYALYTRKSDPDVRETEKSTSEQVHEWQTIAQERGYAVVHTYEESQSALTSGQRPLYNDLVKRIHAGQVNAILCWKINRLARNMREAGDIAQLLIDGHLREIRTPTAAFRTGDNILPLLLEQGMSAQYSLDLITDVVRGMEGHFQRGGHNSRAPQGYYSARHPVLRKVGIVLADEERFPVIRKGWELMLTGAYTAFQVVDILNRCEGYRTRRTAGGGYMPLSRTAGYRIFRDPFYAGYVHLRGELKKGEHPAMVTEAEFAVVQELLNARSSMAKSRKAQAEASPEVTTSLPQSGIGITQRIRRQEYAYTGLMRCGDCGMQITAERHTVGGKPYVFYRCSDTYRRCTKKGMAEPAVEAQIIALLDRVTLAPEVRQLIQDELGEFLKDWESKTLAQQEKREKAVREVEAQRSRLEEMWLEGLITDPTRYKAREKELTDAQNALLMEAEGEGGAADRIRENVAQMLRFLGTAREAFQEGSPRRKREIALALAEGYVFCGRTKEITMTLHPLLKAIVRLAPVELKLLTPESSVAHRHPTERQYSAHDLTWSSNSEVPRLRPLQGSFEVGITGSGSTKKLPLLAAVSSGGAKPNLVEVDASLGTRLAADDDLVTLLLNRTFPPLDFLMTQDV